MYFQLKCPFYGTCSFSSVSIKLIVVNWFFSVLASKTKSSCLKVSSKEVATGLEDGSEPSSWCWKSVCRCPNPWYNAIASLKYGITSSTTVPSSFSCLGFSIFQATRDIKRWGLVSYERSTQVNRQVLAWILAHKLLAWCRPAKFQCVSPMNFWNKNAQSWCWNFLPSESCATCS